MSDSIRRATQATVVLFCTFMILSMSAVYVTAAVAAPSAPDADGATAGDTPADNSTARDVVGAAVDTGAPLDTADSALAAQDGDASIARANLELVRDLRALSDQSTSQRDEALDMAETVLDHRQQWAASESKPLSASMTPRFEAAQTKLKGARRILETNQELQDERGLSRAITLAKQGTQMQAAQADESLAVGDDLPAVESPDYASPSAAISHLMAGYRVTPTAEDVEKMQSLDDLPEPQRSALTDYLNAFIAFQRATALGNRTRVYAARNELLDATEELNIAFQSSDAPGLASPEHTDTGSTATNGKTQIGCVNQTIPYNLNGTTTSGPATNVSGGLTNQTYHFCVFTKGDNSSQTYDHNSVVLIDLGGNDIYHNNAGGTNLFDVKARKTGCGLGPASIGEMGYIPNPTGPYGTPDNTFFPTNNSADLDVAAALVDYGTGDDEYTRSEAYGCGQRGGANIGSGFLLDAGGSDDYGNETATDTWNYGTNGGASASMPADQGCCVDAIATGFLLDAGVNNSDVQTPNAGGSDTFKAGSVGTNGGVADAFVIGTPVGNSGFLMDVNGTAKYVAHSHGTNGGGISGSGFLASLGLGTNNIDNQTKYIAEAGGTNGGGLYQAQQGGFLLDAGGDDFYHATSQGTNGGGAEEGGGFLLDAGVNQSQTSGSGGSDTFKTGHGKECCAHNPGLFETGNASRDQGMQGVNGGAKEAGVGVLIDIDGSTTYKAGDGQGANGGAFEAASGLLMDTGGDDTYIAGYDPTDASGDSFDNPSVTHPSKFPTAGTNGGGAVGGVGNLVDVDGSDTFDTRDGHFGGINATNGGGWSLGTGGVGLLASIGGQNDLYKAVSKGTESGPVTGANGGGSGYGEFIATSAIEATIQFTNGTLHSVDDTINNSQNIEDSPNLDDHMPDVKPVPAPATRATGSLVDLEGVNDTYKADTGSTSEPVAAVNGGAYGTTSTGLLIDAGDDDNANGDTDKYKAFDDKAGSQGENGGVFAQTTANPPNASSVTVDTAGVGLLLDVLGDHDKYRGDYCGDDDTNKNEDTVVPKGHGNAGKGTAIAGAQIDSSSVLKRSEWGCGTNTGPV